MSEMIELSTVCDRLSAADCVLILTHTRPDADTLGSGVALREMLCTLGKKAAVICDDNIPKRLQFITGTASIREDTLPEDFTPDLIMSVDIATSKLLGSYEEKYAPLISLAIDHHALGTPFAAETCILPYGACGEILYELSEEWKRRGESVLTVKAAGSLWAAICSDTGSFKFESVTADTYRRVAALMDIGINHTEISHKLYDSRPLSQVMATKVALNDLHFYHDNRIAVINFTKQMREENNVTREDIDDIVSLTRSIDGVEVGMSIKQSDDDTTSFHVSMRSNRLVDVSLLCAVFGGGGHKRASGCSVNADSAKEAEEKLIAVIEAEVARLEADGSFNHLGECE